MKGIDNSNTGRILIVDDDSDFSLSLLDILESRGFVVETAQDVDSGIEKAKAFDAQVALLDIRLKNGSGLDLLVNMQKIRPGILCVMMTAYMATDTAVNALNEGAYAYLRKPVDIKDLLATLDRCFDKIRLEEEKRIAEEMIRNSLKEKEVLLKEVHHRVKNNLQVIISLLNMQSRYIQNDEAQEYFKDSCNRVHSMALVHEELYRSKNFANIDFKEYIHSLAGNIFRAYNKNPENIKLKFAIDDIPLSVDMAVPSGLIINELISNALKHAFPKDWKEQGLITIIVRKSDNDEVDMVVMDNGIGVASNDELNNSDSLGLNLVRLLVERQLNGKLHFEINNGFKCNIKFRIQSPE